MKKKLELAAVTFRANHIHEAVAYVNGLLIPERIATILTMQRGSMAGQWEVVYLRPVGGQ